MKSPVRVKNIPKFDNKENVDMDLDGGFRVSPEECEGAEEDSLPGGAWEQLAVRHPQLAAELAARVPQSAATWGAARKRRGSQDRPSTEFTNEPRNSRHLRDFFFDDIPGDFREHIPSRWNRHFDLDEFDLQPRSPPSQSSSVNQDPPPRVVRQNSTDKATQTTQPSPPVVESQYANLPHYGLRNTVDLGQKTAAEPGQLDAEAARNQRSMSAPPEARFSSRSVGPTMGNPPQPQTQQNENASSSKPPNVRHIPIFVEGRDEPVINVQKDTATNFAETKAPSQPKEEYFPNHEIPQGFHPTPHFSRAFGSPFKGFSNRNLGSYVPTKGHPQQRDQPQQVFKQQQTGPPDTCDAAPQQHQQQSQTSQNHPQKQHCQQQPQVDHQEEIPNYTEPQRPPPCPNNPILKIQLIQKDVLELMTQVENFKGQSKKEKEYMYLDEMLTRNLIKLDDIETEGKENIRLARKEAIKCIQKCIAVLEAKAESNAEAEAAKNNAIDNKAVSQMEQDTTVTNGEMTQNEKESNSSIEDKRDQCDIVETSDKTVGKKKRDKSREKTSSTNKMDVDNSQSCDGSVQDIKESSEEKPPEQPMEVDSNVPSH